MAKVKLYPELEVPEMLLADRRSAYGLRLMSAYSVVQELVATVSRRRASIVSPQ